MLQYLTTICLNLTYAVNLVCQYMHAPFAHSRAVKRIFRYIKGIVNFGIGLLSNSSLHLYGFSDAD